MPLTGERFDVAELKAAAHGRELDILVDVAGIARELLDGRHHPCPLCGGKDRFRLVDCEAGAVRCSQCFSEKCGDFIAAVQKFQGVNFPEAVTMIAGYLGLAPSVNGNGRAMKPGELLERIAASKNITVESLVAYGALEATRGTDQVVRIPMLDLTGEKCGDFDMGLTEELRKGKAGKGSKLGVFLPHDVDGRPIMPGPDRITLVVEGSKDAAALHGLDFFAVGLPTCKPVNGLAEIFRDCSVILVPDRDEPSTTGFRELAKKLEGVALAVELVELPLPMGEGGDVRDLLKQKDGEVALRAMLKKAAVKVNASTRASDDEPSVTEGRDVSYPCTDDGNARRFVSQHGQNIHYCYPWKKWLVFDGKRWAADQTGATERLAKKTVRGILHEAANTSDKHRMKELTGHAMRSQSAARIAAMLALAQSEPGVPVLPEALDQNNWLFNCENGTIDLRIGKLRSPHRTDLITKLAPVEFDPKAACPTWLEFQQKVTAGSESLVAFKQRLYGLCLTGDTSEQVLVIAWGDGSNGKSTETGTMLSVVGEDYGMQARSELLLAQKGDHPTGQADLFGKRLVICSESDEGRRLSEATVKDLTGSDQIRARRMHQDFWEFSPTHHIIFATNHRPRIKGTDHAIWRRLLLVPFAVRFWNPNKGEAGPPELKQDKRLADRLRVEAPGILAWCVRGCLEWQKTGLGYPEEVRDATEEYREHEDVFGTFLTECCNTETNRSIRSRDLFAAYKQWCERGGERPFGQRKFGEELSSRGFERFTSNGKWYSKIDLTAGDDFGQ